MTALLKNKLLGSQYAAIEVFRKDGRDKYAFVLAAKKKGELIILSNTVFESIQDIKGELNKQPVVLIINNEMVLQKEVKNPDANDKKLLNHAFPNIQPDDFYYEIFRTSNSAIIAVSRKNYIDELISSFKNIANISAISLGITLVGNLAGFTISDVIITNTHQISFNAENFITYSNTDDYEHTYNVNGLQISGTYLLAFCGILQVVIGSNTTGTVNATSAVLLESYLQEAFFRKGIMGGSAVFLALLFINFLLFSYYFDKAGEITQTESLNKSDTQLIKKLHLQIQQKQKRLDNFYNNSLASGSLIINDITKKTPASILLDELVYHPLEKKIKENEEIIAVNDVVTISGITLNNNDFTNWVRDMETSVGIKDIVILSFGKNDKEQTAFSISINLGK